MISCSGVLGYPLSARYSTTLSKTETVSRLVERITLSPASCSRRQTSMRRTSSPLQNTPLVGLAGFEFAPLRCCACAVGPKMHMRPSQSTRHCASAQFKMCVFQKSQWAFKIQGAPLHFLGAVSALYWFMVGRPVLSPRDLPPINLQIINPFFK